MSEFRINDRDGEGGLSILFDGSGEFWVELSGHGMTARQRVDAFMPHGGFDRMFKEMASAWRGWEGEKSWSNIDHALQLVCTHDGLGHIQIAVELTVYRAAHQRMKRWRTTGDLVVESGQLDALAKDAAEFLDDGRLSGL